MTTAIKTKKTTRKTVGAKSTPRRKSIAGEKYTIAIEDLVIVVEGADSGWYIVTCPFDPELMTQGRTLDEAIAMAKDARQALADARAKKPLPAKVKSGGKL